MDFSTCQRYEPKHIVSNQKRKYKEPRDALFEEFKEHLFKLKHEFYPRYYYKQKTVHKIDEFFFFDALNGGSTLLAKHKTIGKYFAVKVIAKNELITNDRIKETKNQKRIAQAIRFPFLLHMEFSLRDKVNIYFVYPFMSGEDLFTLFQRVQVIPERDAKFYGSQILLALEYLHNIDIIYRNIKPENIIFSSNGYVQLSDFKFAKLVDVDMRTYSFCGTPEYVAPEMILNKGYGRWVDWWSYGVLLYEMIAGFTPFESPDPIQTCENILEAKFEFNSNFSSDAQNLICNILQRDISRRYGNLLNGPLDIKCHVWFEVIDWQKIYSQTINPPFIPKIQTPFNKDPNKNKLNIFSSVNKKTDEEHEKDFEDF